MKRVLASLLVLLWPLAFAPKAFATRGGNPDSRLKPLTLKGTGWVSDTEYLLSQNSGDRDTDTAENKPAEHPVNVRDRATNANHARARQHNTSASASNIRSKK